MFSRARSTLAKGKPGSLLTQSAARVASASWPEAHPGELGPNGAAHDAGAARVSPDAGDRHCASFWRAVRREQTVGQPRKTMLRGFARVGAQFHCRWPPTTSPARPDGWPPER